jgi:hypothetical protein
MPVALENRVETKYSVIKYGRDGDLRNFSKTLRVETGRVGAKVDEMFHWASRRLGVPVRKKVNIITLSDVFSLDGYYYSAFASLKRNPEGWKLAFYDRSSNSIYFPARGAYEETLVHEMVHAIMLNAYPYALFDQNWHEEVAEKLEWEY